MTDSLHLFIPAYGDSPYLKECLESVYHNVDPSIVCTVLDDCSPNDKVRRITESFGDRFEYIRNERNLGLALNFQRAVDLSTGSLTVIIGSDDLMLPGFVEHTLKYATVFPDACLIQPGVTVVNKDGLDTNPVVDLVKRWISPGKSEAKCIRSRKILRRLLVGDFFYFPSIAWRTSVIRNFPFDDSLSTAMDLDLLIRLASEEQSFVIGGPSVFKYRRHADSVSMMLGQTTDRAIEEISVQRSHSLDMLRRREWLSYMLARASLTIRLSAVINVFRYSDEKLASLRRLF
jgi:glycosyltransferase involved in cell wall biosynthesis